MPTTAPSHFTSGELGDFLGVQAWKISRLFELGIVEEPARVGGRRLIPKSLIPEIVCALRDRGWSGENRKKPQGVPKESQEGVPTP